MKNSDYNKNAGRGDFPAQESFRRTLMENLPQAVFLKDLNSVYVYCNKNFADDLGIEPSEIKGKTDYDFFPAELADSYTSADRIIINTGKVHELNEKYIRRGREITIHTIKVPARNDNGEIEGVLGIFWDVTKHKQLEDAIRTSRDELEVKVRERTAELRSAAEELRKSEHKFKTLFENIGDIICIHDFEGRILETNTAALEMLGCGKEQLKKMHIQDLEAPEFSQDYSERAARLKRAQRMVYQSAYLSPSGSSIPVEVKARVFEYGGKECVLTVSRDITERIDAEEALFESSQKLKTSLDKSVEALASASEKRDPYTSGHHDRVCELAVAIADRMHLPEETLRAIALAAKIHDIGKLYVPAEILGKPRTLSASEFAIVKLHTTAGYDITKKIDFPQDVSRAILQHHERLDGSGYPMRLQGASISMPGRILAVSDVVEAMTSHRPYRPARGIEEALEEISGKQNSLYDPEIAEVCLELFKTEGFTFGAGV